MPAWTTSPKKEQPTKPLLSLLGFSSKRGLSTELTKSADPSAITVIIGKLPLKGTLHRDGTPFPSIPEACQRAVCPLEPRVRHVLTTWKRVSPLSTLSTHSKLAPKEVTARMLVASTRCTFFSKSNSARSFAPAPHQQGFALLDYPSTTDGIAYEPFFVIITKLF